MIYVSPDRHAEENGYAEASVQIVEIVIKSLLYSHNLPPSWWQRAAADTEFLLNRFPVVSNEVALPLDGDQVLPLEALTNGCYSRAQIRRELSYYIPVGTPALVHDSSVRGSAIKPKVKWGIACGMYREQVWFYCPFTKSKFRSKSYTAYRLKEGINYAQFLRLPPLKASNKSTSIPIDYNEDVAIQLQEPLQDAEYTFVDETPRLEKFGEKVLPDLKDYGNLESGGSTRVLHEDKLLKVDELHGYLEIDVDKEATRSEENGGSTKQDVREEIVESNKTKQDVREEIVESNETPSIPMLQRKRRQKDRKSTRAQQKRKPQPTRFNKTDTISKEDFGLDYNIEIEDAGIDQELIDSREAKDVKHLTHTTNGFDSFKFIVHKRHNLPHGTIVPYHKWLIEVHKLDPLAIPLEPVHAKVKPGLIMPYPSGHRWRVLNGEVEANEARVIRLGEERPCVMKVESLPRLFRL